MGAVNPPSTDPPSAERPPLARLFAMAFRSQIDTLHDELAARGWDDVRPAFGFVLLAARDQPTTSTALAELMGITKQATSKLIDTMQGAGYVVRTTDGVDGRQRLVVMTKRGAKLLVAVEEIYQSIETQWADIIGARDIERMRTSLIKVMEHTNSGQLPPVRPTW
jgi:DNA-binding MarR family transcriptional regulator